MTLAITLIFLAMVAAMARNNAKSRTPESVALAMDQEWKKTADSLGLEHRRTGDGELDHEIVGLINGHDLRVTPSEFMISFRPTDAPDMLVLKQRRLTGRLVDEPRPDAERPPRSFDELVEVVANDEAAAERFLTPERRAALEPIYNHRHLGDIDVARTFIEATTYLSRLPPGHQEGAAPVKYKPLQLPQIGPIVSLLAAAADALASPQDR